MAEPDQLLVARDGPVAIVTFNRPEARKAMTFETYEGRYDSCERRKRRAGCWRPSPSGTPRTSCSPIVLSCCLSEDFKEGVRAFLEKRPPAWQGR